MVELAEVAIGLRPTREDTNRKGGGHPRDTSHHVLKKPTV